MNTDHVIDEIIGHLRENPKADHFPVKYIRLEGPAEGRSERAIVSRDTMYELLRGPLRDFLVKAVEASRELVKIEFEQRMVFIEKASKVPGIEPLLLIKTARSIEDYVTKTNTETPNNTGTPD